MRGEINLNNEYRVLLTETLPYELPLPLNNDGFYENMQNKELRLIFRDIFNGIVSKDDFTIPFDYSIKKYNGDKSRKLSLMHPIMQLSVVDFYNKYDQYLLNLCGRSPFSIRYIVGKSRAIFPLEESVEDNSNEDENEEERKIELKELEIERRYRSYFTYKKYDLIYKFFNSGDNLRLEQKYRWLLKMDIASCFYHIYTHTISWAVKGKETAKRNIGKESFETDFDKLMRQSNYNETNGIIVGPEISRIFAEVILQSVDVSALNILKADKLPLRVGKDYEVRRYVDDYYIYANSKDDLDQIMNVYRKELEKFKLYLNKSKCEYSERPFVSSINMAKEALNKLVKQFKHDYLTKTDDNNYNNRSFRMSLFENFANEFRSIACLYGQKYGQLNRYMLSLLSKQIRREKESGAKPPEQLLIIFVEISFYIFSLDMSTTASYRLCRILQLLLEWSATAEDPSMMKTTIDARISREAKRCLDIYMNQRSQSDDTNLEIMNILLTLDSLTNTKIPEKLLRSIFKIDGLTDVELKKLNYFQICTILRIIKNDAIYMDIHNAVIRIVQKTLSNKECLRMADKAQLFFDICVCPYVDKNSKLDIIGNCLEIGQRDKCGNKLKNITKTPRWFFDWDPTHEISQFLLKKEYHAPYE